MTYLDRPLPSKAFISSTSSEQTLEGTLPHFTELQCRHDVQDRTFWCFLNPQGRPSFTEPLLKELIEVQTAVCALTDLPTHAGILPLGWVVLASRTPGVFSLGGDLTVFTDYIRRNEREELRRYAYDCVRVSYVNATGYGGRAISVGLAQGDALGGGFESLLSCDILVAERRARFGLPEVLMNLFPGMGAHCFLTRRLGSAAAMRMILSGEVFTAEAMHTMGIVDILAEDGSGEDAVRGYIRKNASRHHAHTASYMARRRVSPISLQELQDVTDIWVDTAMSLTEQDLRRMAHLVAAQDRNRRKLAAGTGVAAQ